MCGDAMTIAEDIRRSVREELGLTVSIGVSYNKIFAKLGSDMKKPDAITEICKDRVIYVVPKLKEVIHHDNLLQRNRP